MIKAIAILAFAGVASAGLLAAPQQLAYAQPAFLKAPVAYAQAAYAQPALLKAPVYAQAAYAQPALLKAPVAYAQPALLKAPVAYAQPIVKAVAAEPFDPNPQYSYGYSVSDALTGDSKTASETRNGDLVQGQYSLVEPDGSIRTVTYTADAINGFNAVVDRQPAVVKAVKTIAAPVAYAQPAYLKAAPVAYAQPAYLKAAPVAYAQSPVLTKTIYG